MLGIATLALQVAATRISNRLMPGWSPYPARRKLRPDVAASGNGPEPDTLDPQVARTDGAIQHPARPVRGTDVGRAGRQRRAGAAESWTVSPDGREYVFKLRPGLRWSNGDPVKAADYVAGLRRLVDPATASPYAQAIEPVENAPAIAAGKQAPETLGVSAPDEQTVTIRLATRRLTAGLAGAAFRRAGQRGVTRREWQGLRAPGKLVSNGAFMLEDWVIGSHVVLKRNPNYWNNAATKPRARAFRAHTGCRHRAAPVPARSSSTRRTSCRRSSSVDQAEPRGRAARVAAAQHLLLRLQPDPAAIQEQPGLRRALSLVIERDKLTSAITGVGEAPAYGWVPPGVWNYSPQHFDYAYAALCRARGRGAQAVRRCRVFRRQAFARRVALQHGRRAQPAGRGRRVDVEGRARVETSLYAEEFKALLQTIQARQETQVFRSSWVGDYNDAFSFAQLLQSDFGINLTGYDNPQYDAPAAARPSRRPTCSGAVNCSRTPSG
jgi:ABC-type oligopeptide transport system substrate-binding subunit